MMILLIIVYKLVLEYALRDLQIQIKKRGGEGIMIWDLCLCSKGTADGRSLKYHNHLQRLFKTERLWKSKYTTYHLIQPKKKYCTARVFQGAKLF